LGVAGGAARLSLEEQQLILIPVGRPAASNFRLFAALYGTLNACSMLLGTAVFPARVSRGDGFGNFMLRFSTARVVLDG